MHRHAGIVDQQVDPAEALERLGHQPLALIALGDVGGYHKDVRAGFLATEGDFVQLLLVAGGEHQARSLRSDSPRQLGPDAVGRAGQDDRLVGEAVHGPAA